MSIIIPIFVKEKNSMVIHHISSKIDHQVVIEKVTTKDFAVIKKMKAGFSVFDWSKYKGQEVYKLRLAAEDNILGLMCLVDHVDPGTNAIEIELLEIGEENKGNKKEYDHIAGCLIAFACRESVIRNHDGFVFLVPKSNLIGHYRDKYGFEHFAFRTAERPEGIMQLIDQASRKLIKKYIG